MAEQGAPPAVEEAWWCRACGERVTLSGSPEADPRHRGAVHSATGQRTAWPDGHAADPVDAEPPLWAAAGRLMKEFGRAFTIIAWYGILRADWAVVTTPVHYESKGEDDMRRQLDQATAGTRWARRLEGAPR
jgi:hypothetical protein